MKTLIMGLGNDLLADDGVGIVVAKKLREHLADRDDIDIIETAMHGMALLDMFIGYEQSILIDAIATGDNPPGTITEIDPDSLPPVQAPSPHFAGLPEMILAAKQLDLDFPKQFHIVAVEVIDPLTLGGEMTEPVKNAIPALIEKVMGILKQSKNE